ncbi:17597_t:CDS:2, partial [Gigaspora rosea]
QFKSLMNDWFIIEKPVDPEDTNEDLIKISLLYYEYISNMMLKKHVPRKKVKKLLNDLDFYRELASVYRKMVKDNETDAHYYLHVGDIVTISEKEDKSFAILRSILSHKRDNQHFAFIIIDRFELTNQKKLECPVYGLQNT